MATWDTVDSDTYNRLIIIKKMLRDDPCLLDFLFDPSEAELCVSPSVVLDRFHFLSSGEQLLIRVALDIWSGEGHAEVRDILSTLDPYRFDDVIQALCRTQRGLRESEFRRQLKFPTRQKAQRP